MERWIIVGAGSAGCVLANRLSADGTREILLLDDGPELAPDSVPAGVSGSSFFDAMREPGRLHEDLLASRTTGGEQTLYQRGRGVGGSSAVNAMIALRGSDDLYRSWGWHDVDEAWDRILIPTEPAAAGEVGEVDMALRTDESCQAAQMTRRSGARVTSAEAYLWPILERPNLSVRPTSAVHSVTLHDRRAVGVRLVDGEELPADRVIVAAGAIHSPVILLRSGVDTPGVGEGLQDHPSAVFTLQLRDGVVHDPSAVPISSVLHESVDANVLQILPMNHLGPDPETAGLGALMAALMTPVGRAGSVRIDDVGDPVVDFALLDDPRDVQGLTAAVLLALDLLDTMPFQEIVAEAYIDDQGSTTDGLIDDEAAIATWLRSHCADYVHATSTCAMGTVVDDSGAVIGYESLYVIDASVFPSIPDANTHFPTTMLAERLSARLIQ